MSRFGMGGLVNLAFPQNQSKDWTGDKAMMREGMQRVKVQMQESAIQCQDTQCSRSPLDIYMYFLAG